MGDFTVNTRETFDDDDFVILEDIDHSRVTDKATFGFDDNEVIVISSDGEDVESPGPSTRMKVGNNGTITKGTNM